MEQFYSQKSSLKSALTAIRWFAFADVTITVAVLYIHLLWTDITLVYSILFVFHIFHAFSWMAGLAVTSNLYALEYVLMTGMVYVVCFLTDVAALVWRSIILSGSANKFSIGALVFNCLYIVLDSVLVLLLTRSLSLLKVFKDQVSVALEATSVSHLQKELYTKHPFPLVRARNAIMMTSILDLFLWLGVMILFALGLGITITFQNLIYMQIPHAFLWVAGLAIYKELLDAEFAVTFVIFYSIAIGLDAASVFWRVFLIASCTSCSFFVIFAWITLGLVFVMVIVDGVQIVMALLVIRYLKVEFERLLPLVKRRLNPNQPRFYS